MPWDTTPGRVTFRESPYVFSFSGVTGVLYFSLFLFWIVSSQTVDKSSRRHRLPSPGDVDGEGRKSYP